MYIEKDNPSIVKGASVLNSINTRGYSVSNHGSKISREAMLSNYTDETLDMSWRVLCQYIARNYTQGKGTIIKGFGTFTFTSPKVNLEGTTNQFDRDSKPRTPVFIVSPEFNQSLKPGQYSPKYGIIYYTQKLNNGINHIKANYAEMSYGISLSKDECSNIIKHLLGFISECINEGKFKKKEMPELGTLILNKNIIGVKFNNDIINICMGKSEVLKFTKNNIHLGYNMDSSFGVPAGQLRNSFNNVEMLRPTTSVITKIEKNADCFMKNTLDINVNKIPNHKIHNIYRSYSVNKGGTTHINFLKDYKINEEDNKSIEINNKTKYDNILNKMNQTSNTKKFYINGSKLSTLNLSEDLLQSFEFFKGVLISNMRKYDINSTGSIRTEDCINALYDSAINDKIDLSLSKKLIDIYSGGLISIDYMKFITCLIKDAQSILLSKKLFISDNKNNNKTYINNNLNSNSVKNNQNELFKRTFNNFNQNLKLNKSGMSRQILFTKIKELDEIKIELNSIKNIMPDLKEKYRRSLDQNISIDEFMHELEEFSIVYTKDKILKILNYIEIENIFAFCLDELDYKIKNCIIANGGGDKNNKIKICDNNNKINENSKSNPSNKHLKSSNDISNINLITNDDIVKGFDIIKDLIFFNGGKNYLFPNNKNSISCDEFVNLFKNKNQKLSENLIITIYNYLVKTNRNFDINDYIKYIENAKSVYDSDFETKAMKAFINLIEKKHLKTEEYYDHLLTYNKSTKNKFISRIDFIKIMQKENINYSAEDLNYIFTYIDYKKDNVIDREEFMSRISHETLPLTLVQNIIKNYNLDIEDLCHRMKLNRYSKEHIIYNDFVNKIKALDYTFSNEFILSLFNSLKEKQSDNYINSEKLIKEFDVFKKEYLRHKQFLTTENSKSEFKNEQFLNENEEIKDSKEPKKPEYIESFTKYYMDKVKSKIPFNKIKKMLEDYDVSSTGKVSRLDFASVMHRIVPEFKDEENMKIVRITDMFENNLIKYPELLNLIYYDEKSDNFTHLVDILNKEITTKFKGSIENFMKNITKTYKIEKLTIEQLGQYLDKIINENLNGNNDTLRTNNNNNNKNNKILKKTICKLDLDADGLISYEDLRGVLGRYVTSSYFKYENCESEPNVNIHPTELMKDEKFKIIVKKLKEYMKIKNINEIGLFKKIDKNNDGFISNIDFNETIDSILPLAPAIKDQFFNYLDYYRNGLVDLDTFIYRFKEFTTGCILPKNNNYIETIIIDSFNKFLIKNQHLSDTEIFSLMDRDCDGVINLFDFRYFVINSLNVSKYEFNDYKLERCMQALSLSKNKQIGINDIREFMDKSKSKINNQTIENNNNNNNTLDKNITNLKNVNNNYHINLKEIYKTTANQNLCPDKVNTNWINEITERFGMYISEKYDNIKQFFEKNTEKGSNKFKFEDFLKFHEKNYDCFNNGFNLTKDELLSIFTSLDSQKKNYLLIEDLENKLQIFDYYKKMHIDVKNFIKQNFYNGYDAFKFFIKNTNKIPNEMSPLELEKKSITKKEFFDAFSYFFPKKYATETILKYFNKYFNNKKQQNSYQISNQNSITKEKEEEEEEVITFSLFNYVYFDKMDFDCSFIRKRLTETKLMTSRKNKIDNNMARTQVMFKPHNKMLITPFDNDSLNKIKRIVQSSRFDLNKFFQIASTMALDGNVNKFQFRNIIKQLDIGLTNLEIDEIINRSNMSFGGKINIENFIKFLRGEDNIITEGKENISKIIGDIKHLIYKYYSNPIICFQFNDKSNQLLIDFEKFKQIVLEMYKRDMRQPPSFTLIKNAFDTLDLRKDGIIDMNEWMRSFGAFNSSLDYKSKHLYNEDNFNVDIGYGFVKNKRKNTSVSLDCSGGSGGSSSCNVGNSVYDSRINSIKQNRKNLREWESSKDICDIYKLINKNRKVIRNSIGSFAFGNTGEALVHIDNFVSVLKNTFPYIKLSYTQWRILVMIGKSEIDGLISLDTFFKMIELTVQNLKTHPKTIY